MRSTALLSAVCLACALAGCGGGGGDDAAPRVYAMWDTGTTPSGTLSYGYSFPGVAGFGGASQYDLSLSRAMTGWGSDTLHWTTGVPTINGTSVLTLDAYGRVVRIEDTVVYPEGATHTVVLDLHWDDWGCADSCVVTMDGDTVYVLDDIKFDRDEAGYSY